MASPSVSPARILPRPERRERRSSSAARSGVRLELTRRGRAAIAIIAFVLGLLVAAAGLLVLDVPSALAGGQSEQQLTITAEPGDTLWGYAQQYAPEGVGEQEYIAQVRGLNHLPTGRMTAGQEVLLPAPGDTAR